MSIQNVFSLGLTVCSPCSPRDSKVLYIKFSLLKEIHPDTDVKNSLLDSVGEGEGRMI